MSRMVLEIWWCFKNMCNVGEKAKNHFWPIYPKQERNVKGSTEYKTTQYKSSALIKMNVVP